MASLRLGRMALLCIVLAACARPTVSAVRVERTPAIRPDYSQVIVPPNMAPLNFRIDEAGTRFHVRFCDRAGTQINLDTDGRVQIPLGQWRRLLTENRGGSYTVEVAALRADGTWETYAPLVNQVAEEPIDSYLVYRLINAGHVLWETMGIYQRDLESFDERPLLTSRATRGSCMNCHAFANHDPARFLLHLRAGLPGTLLVDGDRAERVDTRIPQALSALGHPAWHPNGRYIAFSVNATTQDFSADERCPIEVYDTASDLVIYDVVTHQVTTAPQVSTPARENLPAWSPDGRWLYYISAPQPADRAEAIGAAYSLVRIPCDPGAGTWGEPDTLLSAGRTRRSYSFPRVSPDGRWLVFSAADHGYFTIHNATSDLWVMDLETRTASPLPVNSDLAESYHCWSANGRWLVFSSKRLDGRYARPFLTHVDAEGHFSKPLVMPQRDPDFYDTCLLNYNIPELVQGPIPLSSTQLRDLAYTVPVPARLAPAVRADGLSGDGHRRWQRAR
jgi:prolyl oligopeptidase family protein